MKNKNLVIAVAAGTAAAIVAGIILKRTGGLTSLMDRLHDLADSIEEKFGRRNVASMQDIIPKGEDRNISETPQHRHHHN